MASPTSITEVVVPTNLDWGWVTQYQEKYHEDGPPGVSIAYNPRVDTPTPAYYLDAGADAVQTPGGSPSYTPFLTPAQKFTLSGRDAAVQGKQFRDYTDADTDGCIARAVAGGGAKWMSGDFTEIYDGTGFNESDNPRQYERWHKGMASAFAAIGCIWCGEYDGPDLINNNLADPAMWNGLNGTTQALAFLSGRGFYKYQIYNYGGGVVSNHYMRGAPGGGHERMWEHEAQLALTTLARQATGVNFPILAYLEGTFNEFTGVTTRYTRRVPSGGHVFTTGDGSGIGFGIMLVMASNLAAQVDCIGNFAGPEMYGRSMDVIQNNAVNQWGSTIFQYYDDGTHNNPLRSNSRPWYDYTPNDQFGQHGGPYPNKPLGFEDTIPVGFDIAGELYRWVGTKAFDYPTVTMDGTTYTPGAAHSFLKVIRDSRLPWVRGRVNTTTRKGWVRYYYVGGKTIKNAVLTIGGVDVPVRMIPGCPQYFKFTY